MAARSSELPPNAAINFRGQQFKYIYHSRWGTLVRPHPMARVYFAVLDFFAVFFASSIFVRFAFNLSIRPRSFRSPYKNEDQMAISTNRTKKRNPNHGDR